MKSPSAANSPGHSMQSRVKFECPGVEETLIIAQYGDIWRKAFKSLLTAFVISACCLATLKAQSAEDGFFVRNKGQWDNSVLALSAIAGMDVWLTRDAIVYDVYRYRQPRQDQYSAEESKRLASRSRHSTSEALTRSGHVLAMQFVGAKSAQFHGEKPLSAYYNYFIGRDSSRWVHSVPLFRELLLSDLYPGIHARMYFDGGKVRYDLIAEPLADPAQVRLAFPGAVTVGLRSDGTLLLGTSLGDVEQRGLFAYQHIDGEKRQVRCAFELSPHNEVQFALGEYDRTLPLVIDPLVYSTYMGGAGWQRGTEVAVNEEGEAYITGWSNSHSYPTTPGAYDEGSITNRATGVFISKMNAAGSDLVFSSFIGGRGLGAFAEAKAIALDQSDNIYITGWANELYPTTLGAHSEANQGERDVIVSSLSADGRSLRYSTFIGGARRDRAEDLALDNNANVYVTGQTSSPNFPWTDGAFDESLNGIDAFVLKLSADGSALWYASALGGHDNPSNNTSWEWGEQGTSIAVDEDGAAIVAGETSSSNFPATNGAFDQRQDGGTDAFVAKFNPQGSALIFATLLGGSVNEGVLALATDADGNIYVTGGTESDDFPHTPDAYFDRATPHTPNLHSDVFVSKISRDGSNLVYSALFGGFLFDHGLGIAVNDRQQAIVKSFTWSDDFPLSDNAEVVDPRSLTFSILAADGETLLYSSYFGGNAEGVSTGIRLWNGSWGSAWSVPVDGDVALDKEGNIFTTGATTAPNFPTTEGAFDRHFSGKDKLDIRNTDAYLTKIGLPIVCDFSVEAQADIELCPDQPFTLTVATRGGEGPEERYEYRWRSDDATISSDERSPALKLNKFGRYTFTVTVSDAAGCVNSDEVQVVVREAPAAEAGEDTTICAGTLVRLGGEAQTGYEYSWSPAEGLSDADQSDPQVAPTATQRYVLTVRDEFGCEARDSVLISVRPGELPPLVISGETELCAGERRELLAQGDFDDYRWSNGATTAAITVDAAGVYRVEARKQGFCGLTSAAIQVTVHPLPRADIAGPVSACLKSTTLYAAAADDNVAYRWSLSGGGRIIGDAASRQTTIEWNAAGVWTVELRTEDMRSGCTSTSTLSVTVGDELTSALRVGGPLEFCEGGSVTLDAGPGFESYQWSNGQNGRAIVVTSSGTYSVRLRDRQGCSGSSDTVDVTVFEPPIVDAGEDLTICPGERAQLSAAGASSYEWSPPGLLDDPTGPTPQATPETSTLFIVRGSDAEGCTAVDSVWVRVRDNLALGLRATDALGVPGTDFSLPITLEVPAAALPLPALTLRFSLRYPANLLQIEGLSEGRIIGQGGGGDQHSIVIEVTSASINSTTTTLTRLEGFVLLSAQRSGTLELFDATLSEDACFSIIEHDASFGIHDFCVGYDLALFTPLAIAVDPNPLTDGIARLRLRSSAPGPHRLALFDSFGRMVWTRQWQRDTNDATEVEMLFDAKQLSDGVYLLQASAGGQSQTVTMSLLR